MLLVESRPLPPPPLCTWGGGTLTHRENVGAGAHVLPAESGQQLTRPKGVPFYAEILKSKTHSWWASPQPPVWGCAPPRSGPSAPPPQSGAGGPGIHCTPIKQINYHIKGIVSRDEFFLKAYINEYNFLFLSWWKKKTKVLACSFEITH